MLFGLTASPTVSINGFLVCNYRLWGSSSSVLGQTEYRSFLRGGGGVQQAGTDQETGYKWGIVFCIGMCSTSNMYILHTYIFGWRTQADSNSLTPDRTSPMFTNYNGSRKGRMGMKPITLYFP